MFKTIIQKLACITQKLALSCRVNDLVLLEIKINGELAPPLSVISHRDNAFRTGKALCSKLKELIPRQMFRVPIQVSSCLILLCVLTATCAASYHRPACCLCAMLCVFR